MPKHDYKCGNYECRNYEFDVIVPYGEEVFCPECCAPMEITYEFWDDVALEDHGRSRNEKADHNGFVKNWSATDDPLARLELLGGSLKDKGVITFTPDQQAAFRQRILVEGDSPKLRKDILAQRKANIQEKKEETKKKVQQL